MSRAETGGMLLIALIALASCGGDDGGADTSAPVASETVATSTPASRASPVADGAVRLVEAEVYRTATDDGSDSTVDIHVGAGNEGGPLVVLLHGFGMTGPGRPLTSVDALAEEVAALGSTVFSFGWHSGFGFSSDSAADFSCVGPFVAARAAEFGADPDKVVVVGHSMGGEAGGMLAFSSFDLAPAPGCAENGDAPDPVAFVGIAGAYGMVGEPIDGDATRYRLRTYPQGSFEELGADEEIAAGLTAGQLYALDVYRAIPPVTELDIVLAVGSEDQFPVSDVDVTSALAEALRAADVDLPEVVVVDGADHDNIVFPDTEFGGRTLGIIADVFARIA